MIAAAVAAMGAGAFAAGECSPVVQEVARIYQMQMNVYTTRGYLSAVAGTTGSICTPGETSKETCTVLRGKDKTVIRGYVYICSDLCKLEDYAAAFVDSKRKAAFGEFGTDEEGRITFASSVKFEWQLLNFMGSKFDDVEAAWTFSGPVTYAYLDGAEQQYDLVGAGYGKKGSGTTVFADKLSGNFAGTAGASYDTYNSKASTCACTPSSILTCDGYATLAYSQKDTVAFGSWKMKFNANDSKAYYKGTFDPLSALKKIMQ